MRYFVVEGNQPLEYISCGNLISKQEFLHPRRNIDAHVLIMVKEGILPITQGEIDYEIHPKQYIFLKANEEHYGAWPSEGKLSYLWVHFSIRGSEITLGEDEFSFTEMDSRLKNMKNIVFIMPECGEIALTHRAPLLFNQLLDLSRHDNLYTSQITNYALSLLIMEISQEFLDRNNKFMQNIPPQVGMIMEWIKVNYYRPITVADIAEEFSYNTDYLSALFKKSTGTNLVSYINKTRVDIAKSLITNYDISIKEAAYSCGFYDEKYFMKTFKRYENMTPSQYKKAFTRKRLN